MTIKKFIKKLERIVKEHGPSLEVKMADDIPVVSPVCTRDFMDKKVVVITDQEGDG
ncbi:MAG: hypothetical protein UT00_C0011G0007 [Parcubacteria group bacterium GW2011_GWA1_38_7]|nr:MAG: hypothetical protein UT00_C0011G0007 [Parcubacteria group bacterium GW2011_GWA1_38_7]